MVSRQWCLTNISEKYKLCVYSAYIQHRTNIQQTDLSLSPRLTSIIKQPPHINCALPLFPLELLAGLQQPLVRHIQWYSRTPLVCKMHVHMYHSTPHTNNTTREKYIEINWQDKSTSAGLSGVLRVWLMLDSNQTVWLLLFWKGLKWAFKYQTTLIKLKRQATILQLWSVCPL